jgi:hypothetical protein
VTSPADQLATLTHAQLATLARELLLCGHLIDRATMPHVLGAWDREVMRDVAIDEWMGASPLYTRRTQALLGIEGDDVAAIFKAMQFDIGAPPQFMDFRYSVHDAHHGEFHLDHCGALMDVEPMGSEYVFTMCHEIEDPTFDATAWATNARARMRPVHRPPREPADRHPHCAWTVTIDPAAAPLPEPAMATHVAGTNAAQLPLATHPPAVPTDDGAADYAGPLVDDVDFGAFSSATLAALVDEIALQQHLLAIAGLASIAGRFGSDAARDIGRHQLTGAAGVTAERLHAALELGAGLADLAVLFGVHPLLRPTGYVAVEITVADDELRLDLADCPALHEAPQLSWPELLLLDEPTPLDVIAQAVDATLRVEPVDPRPGAVAAFVVRGGAAPARRHPDVEFARFSTGADFAFTDEGTRVRLRARRARPTDRPRPV